MSESMAAGSMVATVVRFTATLTNPDMARLAAAYGGLRFDRPIPPLAYLERLPAGTVDALREDFLVAACLPLDPTEKLAPWLSAVPGQPLELIAVLFDDADPAAVVAALGAIGARDIEAFDDRPIGGFPHVSLTLDDPAGLPQVAAIGEVVWVEPVPSLVSRNVEAAQTIQSGTVGTHGSPIWDKGLTGKGEIIGILDDHKIDIEHCFFADGAPNQPGPGHRKVIANLSMADVDPNDHFMFVAAIAAGDDRNHPGQHRHRGGAWAARLVCRSRFDMRVAGFSLLQMLDSLEERNAVIHNISWGDERGAVNYNTLSRDADKFTWENESHIVVAAGGNTGESGNSPPGNAKNTLCVAAAEGFPNEMGLGSWVAGPTVDGRRKPEIVAVGCDIESALLHPTNKCATGLLTTRKRCSTSWATPHVSAAAALVRQYFREGWYPSGEKVKDNGVTPSGALIKAMLLNSTVDMTRVPGYPSNDEGWGLIRLDRTLHFKNGPRRLAVRDVRRDDGMAHGEERTFYLQVRDDSQELKITLVWTEPPPSEKSFANPTVNTIQLAVRDPNGVRYRGNDINVSIGQSKPNGTAPLDQVNNVHMVIVKSPPAGLWIVTIRATVRAGKQQGFALVATGSLLINALISP